MGTALFALIHHVDDIRWTEGGHGGRTHLIMYALNLRVTFLLTTSIYITVANWCENDVGTRLCKFYLHHYTIPTLFAYSCTKRQLYKETLLLRCFYIPATRLPFCTSNSSPLLLVTPVQL